MQCIVKTLSLLVYTINYLTHVPVWFDFFYKIMNMEAFLMCFLYKKSKVEIENNMYTSNKIN